MANCCRNSFEVALLACYIESRNGGWHSAVGVTWAPFLPGLGSFPGPFQGDPRTWDLPGRQGRAGSTGQPSRGPMTGPDRSSSSVAREPRGSGRLCRPFCCPLVAGRPREPGTVTRTAGQKGETPLRAAVSRRRGQHQHLEILTPSPCQRQELLTPDTGEAFADARLRSSVYV